MKRAVISALVIGTAVLLSSCATKENAQASGALNPGAANESIPATAADGMPVIPPASADAWPMIFTDGATRYTVFEPQCDSWDGHQLIGRCAVAVQPADQSQPTYGVFRFSAVTLVDKTSRTAALAGFKLNSAVFPSAPDAAKNYVPPVVLHLVEHAPPLPLDHLEKNLVLTAAPKAGLLDNAPPEIIVSRRPAVLVYIDGPPAWRPVSGTGLRRAINTRVLLLKDPSNNYYLHLFDGYLQAASLDGPWKVAGRPPVAADVAENEALDSGQVDLMQGEPDATTHEKPTLARSPVPDVHVATRPAELVSFDGAPQYNSIPGTDLLYAANTSGDVFKLLTDQKSYILISGRWYSASSLDGPWRFVPGNQLPKDFANIPDDSPKENVKASVPGTRQAEEALIANSIPQSTAVSRSTTMEAPQVDGSPQLAPIAGTPLQYVVNSATPIIEVDPQSWYACQNGVWYAATSDDGPWTVAASVPAVIYTIPPDSPLHYVTYVQVYGANFDDVYEGYTPGYLGTEVSDDGTVVYGTGYDYTPWIGSVWYGPPITWGCGFNDCWTPWWGWGFDCGFGWGWGFSGWGCYPPFPWWGGYRGWHDFDRDGWRDADRRDLANTGGDFYRHHEQFGQDGWRNHFVGNGSGRFSDHHWPGDFGRAYNSRTGRIAAGQAGGWHQVSGSAWNPVPGSHWTQNRPALANRSWTVLRPGRPFSTFHAGNFYPAYHGGQVSPLFNTGSRVINSPRAEQMNHSSFGGWRGEVAPAPRAGAQNMGGYHGGGGGFRGGETGGYHGGGGWGGGGHR